MSEALKKTVAFRAPGAGSTGADPTGGAFGASLLRDSAWYVGLISLTLAIMLVLALIVGPVLRATLDDFQPPDDPGFRAVRVVSHLTILGLSIAMFLLARRAEIRPRALRDVSLGFEVVVAFGMALPLFFAGPVDVPNFGRVPWVCTWIVLFPLVVPAPLRRHAVASAAAATMVPIAWAISRVAGYESLQTTTAMAFTFLPGYLCAAMALIPASRLHRLVESVGEAEKEARRLGSYQLVEPLGKGGMGEVWRARHAMLSRPAAVKLIRSDLAGSARAREINRERFEREAKATATLECPHTITLFDYGVTDDQALYYVMEYLNGSDLETLVERFGPLPPARVVHVLRQVCESLAEAHEAGMVHRDIKPANIYLCRLGRSFDFVKVLDFGLVTCMRCPETGKDVRLTQDGFVVGTVAYMSPEMAEGGEKVDARADVYALGCVAYWLLTGQLLFDHPSPMKVLMMHANDRPVMPTAVNGILVPEPLENLMMRCLEKDPDRRPADASEVIRLLDDCDQYMSERWTEREAEAWWGEHLPQHHRDSSDAGEPVSQRETEVLPG